MGCLDLFQGGFKLFLKDVKLRECFIMLLPTIQSVPNEDKDERNALQPNCDRLIHLEPTCDSNIAAVLPRCYIQSQLWLRTNRVFSGLVIVFFMQPVQ